MTDKIRGSRSWQEAPLHDSEVLAQLADALISPTHYMTAFLRERAWRLPKTSLVIPNVLPALEPGQERPEASPAPASMHMRSANELCI